MVDQSLLEENYAEQATLRRTVADEYDRERASDNANRKRVFTAEDIQKFYNAFKNNMGEYPVVVLFLLETGMRISEFASLRNDNINLDSGRIDIVETRAIRFVDDKDHSKGIEEYVKVPKNKEARFVIMSELAKECVLYMMEQTKLKCKNNPDDLLYPSFRSGKRRTNCSMEVCFKDLCDKLEIDRDVRMSVTRDKDGNEVYVKKGLCLHDLRHTSDSIANAVAGANVVNTALKMGHKAITTENVYTHATEEGLASVRTPSQVFLDGYKKDGAEPDTSSEKRISELEALLLQQQNAHPTVVVNQYFMLSVPLTRDYVSNLSNDGRQFVGHMLHHTMPAETPRYMLEQVDEMTRLTPQEGGVVIQNNNGPVNGNITTQNVGATDIWNEDIQKQIGCNGREEGRDADC